MELAQNILFDPLLPLPVIGVIAAVALVLTALALWRGLKGWLLRGFGFAALILALLQPALQDEEREPLRDIVLVVVDESASQRLSDRAEQSQSALAEIEAEVAGLGMDVVVSRVGDGEENAGTLMMRALNNLLGEVPRARIAGALLVTDGQIHDAGLAPDLPAPIHAILTGQPEDWDRRLVVQNAPAFAILDEEFELTLRIEDQGAVPADAGATSELLISIDGGTPFRFNLPVGEDITVPLTLDHAGRNVVQFSVPEAEGELTDRNNEAVIQINGVRDRLSVLLVSGEPHPGQRTWRNLLKSDPAVDLVHFTILRPPDKQDGVPVAELSLIAFPTRELFTDAINDFDLIIFDRYQRRGILPMVYLDNVRQYVEDGGAVLVAAGPDFASADSIYRSPLSLILPGEPTARVVERPFLPMISEIGARHPVTTGLEDAHAPLAGSDAPWGRWFRQIELIERGGQTVMTGTDGAPLLMLDRVGEGRVALLASDHAWLWDRGYEGGGPQLEMLRRLAHWMMGEPELEEEALQAETDGETITITRQSLAPEVGPVTVTNPDGSVVELTLDPVRPGRFEAEYDGPEQGLYRLREGAFEAVIALGPAAPREFEQTIASGARLEEAVAQRRGGTFMIHEGLPDFRRVSEGRIAAGSSWLGLTPRDAYLTTDIRVIALIQPWLFLLLSAGLMIAAWLREGGRTERG
ncbi:MAG: hypothetical protein AAFN09_09945 [Pseudomonadota bacterium]